MAFNPLLESFKARPYGIILGIGWSLLLFSPVINQFFLTTLGLGAYINPLFSIIFGHYFLVFILPLLIIAGANILVSFCRLLRWPGTGYLSHLSKFIYRFMKYGLFYILAGFIAILPFEPTFFSFLQSFIVGNVSFIFGNYFLLAFGITALLLATGYWLKEIRSGNWSLTLLLSLTLIIFASSLLIGLGVEPFFEKPGSGGGFFFWTFILSGFIVVLYKTAYENRGLDDDPERSIKEKMARAFLNVADFLTLAVRELALPFLATLVLNFLGLPIDVSIAIGVGPFILKWLGKTIEFFGTIAVIASALVLGAYRKTFGYLFNLVWFLKPVDKFFMTILYYGCVTSFWHVEHIGRVLCGNYGKPDPANGVIDIVCFYDNELRSDPRYKMSSLNVMEAKIAKVCYGPSSETAEPAEPARVDSSHSDEYKAGHLQRQQIVYSEKEKFQSIEDGRNPDPFDLGPATADSFIRFPDRATPAPGAAAVRPG